MWLGTVCAEDALRAPMCWLARKHIGLCPVHGVWGEFDALYTGKLLCKICHSVLSNLDVIYRCARRWALGDV